MATTGGSALIARPCARLIKSGPREQEWAQMMPAQQLKDPDELVLATLVARRYYIEGRTKIDISDEFRSAASKSHAF